MPKLLPGLIDCHVHFREPGLEHKATISTESAAARKGGVFTVCEMPNTNPGTNSIQNLRYKVDKAAAVKNVCDVHFFFGATTMGHLLELEALFTKPEHEELRRHCCGLKLYLDNSTGNMKASDEVTDAAFALCARLGLTLVAHCEHAGINDECSACIPYAGVHTHSERRPARSEVASIAEAIERARKHGTPLHIAHLSTSGGVKLVAEAKAAKAANPAAPRVTCEVTPHHLFLSINDYSKLHGRGKVNPPLRALEEREALWAAVVDGTIDCLGTDHAPHLLSEKDNVKEGEQPPSGLPGVEVAFPLLLSVALQHWPHPADPFPQSAKLFNLDHLKRLMFDKPNEIFSLKADSTPRLSIVEDTTTVIRTEDQLTKCKWTPYDGWSLKGSFNEVN